MSESDSGRPSVAVLAAESDRAIADHIAADLARLGLEPTVNPDTVSLPQRAVVVLTADALRSSQWRAAVERPAHSRVVPVRIGDVDDREVPNAVKEPNWIEWTPANPATAITAIFDALHSDLSRYEEHRRLTAAANAWLIADKPNHLLIDSAKAVRSAQQHLIDTEHDPLARPTQKIHDFVAASGASTVVLRRKQIRRRLVRSAVVAIAMVVAVTVFVAIRTVANVNRLQGFGTAMPWMFDERPDRVAMLASALLLQGDPPQQPLARRTAIGALSQPWSLGVLGANQSSRLVAAVPDRTGRHTLTYDGDGVLAEWDDKSLTASWRRHLSGADATGLIAADPALTTAVVASGTTLHMITLAPWRDKVVRLSDAAYRLAFAPAQRTVVVQTESGMVQRIPFGGGRATTSQPFDSLLDLRQTSDGGVRALVRIGPDLVVLDPLTDRVLTRAPFADHRFSYGTVAPDSPAIFATGPDRQLYYAADGTALVPTGQPVSDNLDVLTALPGGRVAFGSPEFGIQVFDTTVGVRVGEICRSLMTVGEVVAAADGDVVTCIDYYIVELWRTRELSPLETAPKGIVAESAAPSMREGALSATGGVDGQFTVANGSQNWNARPSTDAITAVSVDAGAAAVVVGTADGTVIQYAVSGDAMTTVGKWQTPDGAAVAEVGRAPNGDRLLVRTATGLWWSPVACTGCDDDSVLLDHVRDRLWGCYTENQVEYLDDDSRDRLRVRLCPPTAGQ